jgi:hypothetical protein
MGLVGGAVLIVATACASPAVSLAPTPSLAPASDACQPIDIRDQSDERVDLTGTWQQVGGGPLFYVSQEGDCVWIAGSFESGAEGSFVLLDGLHYAFDGHLRPDFTVHGHWVILILELGQRYYDPGIWTVDVEVDPWTLRGRLQGDRLLTLEKVNDRWVAP